MAFRNLPANFADFEQQAFRAGVKGSTFFSQPEGSSGALKQPNAEVKFQVGDMARQGRLGSAGGPAGAPKPTVRSYQIEVCQGDEVHSLVHPWNKLSRK